MSKQPVRCSWAKGDLYTVYHDTEWGVPSADERHLFEMLILEGAQAGLSWQTILNKRENYRRLFEGFDPGRVAAFSEAKVEALLKDDGIVRNRAKVQAAVGNAKAYLRVQHEFGGFAPYLWRFVGGKALQNKWQTLSEVPAATEEARQLSNDLLARGFKFVGPTICYAYMQAVGMVNDHVTACFRWKETRKLALSFRARGASLQP